MRDITDIFKKAITCNKAWSRTIFFLVIDRLKEQGIDVSYWDGEENWATILVDNRTVGYIWRKYPIISFERNNLPNIEGIFQDIESINYIIVDSLSTDLFHLNYNDLRDYLDSYLDFDSFTMEDLWFSTNSI